MVYTIEIIVTLYLVRYHSNLHLLDIFIYIKMTLAGGLVAYACNPVYSGDRNQKDGSLKQAQANSSWDPILKNPSQKGTDGVAQVPWGGAQGPEFKPQYHKKNLKNDFGGKPYFITPVSLTLFSHCLAMFLLAFVCIIDFRQIG
jgi:hypothetical protein